MGLDLYTCEDCGEPKTQYSGCRLDGCCEKWVCYNCKPEDYEFRSEDRFNDDDDDLCYLCEKENEEKWDSEKRTKMFYKVKEIIRNSRIKKTDKDIINEFLDWCSW